MDKISIPEEDIVAIDTIAPGVHGLRVMIVNVYSIARSSGDWALVDCGLPYSTGRIRRWAEERFGRPPESILLTHGHFDHTGALQELAEEWNAPVYAHPLERPYLAGEKPYPPPDPTVGGGLMAMLCKLYPRGPVDVSKQLRMLPEDGRVPGFAGWRWIHTPGHTPGHVSFFGEDDKVLIAGDAFTTTKPESFLASSMEPPELHGPPAYFTTDWDAARESVERLAELRPSTLAAGHGRPLSGEDIPGRLAKLASNFDQVARPAHGRYVDEPAGVRS